MCGFFLIKQKSTVSLHPKDFYGNIKDKIFTQLRRTVEGRCSHQLRGFIICILEINAISAGQLQLDAGTADYLVSYSCLVYKLFKNEVIWATVSSVNQNGIFCTAGPFSKTNPIIIFITKIHIPDIYQFATIEGENQWIPTPKLDTNEKDNSLDSNFEDAAYLTNIESNKIVKSGSLLRIRIAGTSWQDNKPHGIGSIKEPFLGLLSSDINDELEEDETMDIE